MDLREGLARRHPFDSTRREIHHAARERRHPYNFHRRQRPLAYDELDRMPAQPARAERDCPAWIRALRGRDYGRPRIPRGQEVVLGSDERGDSGPSAESLLKLLKLVFAVKNASIERG